MSLWAKVTFSNRSVPKASTSTLDIPVATLSFTGNAMGTELRTARSRVKFAKPTAVTSK